MKWAIWTWIWFALMVVGCVYFMNSQLLIIWASLAVFSLYNAITATKNAS